MDVKEVLINKLWLPLAISGGDQLFPSRRKHKKMRLFTLTNMNYQEIKVFEDNRLTRREDIVAWTNSHQQAYRLETELGRSKVLYEGRFDDTIIADNDVISDELPFDILNLDFYSQIPVNGTERVVQEINGEYILVSLLDNLQIHGLVLIYTTLVDQCDLICTNLSFPLVPPLNIINPITDINEKLKFIKCAFNTIIQSSNFIAIYLDELLIELVSSTDRVFSIGAVLRRS